MLSQQATSGVLMHRVQAVLPAAGSGSDGGYQLLTSAEVMFTVAAHYSPSIELSSCAPP